MKISYENCLFYLHLFLFQCSSSRVFNLIFLLSENFLLTFIAKQVYWQQFLSFCLSEKVTPLMKHTFTGYEVIGWWFWSLNMFNILFHSTLAFMVFEQMWDVTFCSFIGKLFFVSGLFQDIFFDFL